jgi:hypothetical protein
VRTSLRGLGLGGFFPTFLLRGSLRYHVPVLVNQYVRQAPDLSLIARFLLHGDLPATLFAICSPVFHLYFAHALIL